MGIEIKVNDEVIAPQSTWTGSVAPITYCGARPVFADVNKTTWCLEAETIKKLINENTKSLIAVDLYGSMPDYKKLEAICQNNGIILVEDAAEALGSTWNRRRAGSFGLFSVHSFHRTKTIATGEGGALLTDDQGFMKDVNFSEIMDGLPRRHTSSKKRQPNTCLQTLSVPWLVHN